jgi:hypothetical protein
LPGRVPALWPPLLLAGLTLLFFHQLAFTDYILARGDTFAYFYPYWQARGAALLAGGLPLWSTELFMGVPLLANSQLGTFYPPNWPLSPLSAPDAVRISLLLHGYWALLGAYLLARDVLPLPGHGWRGQLPALAAAVVYALGGHVGAHVEQINQFQGLAWLPWLFLLYRAALRRPARCAPLLAAALALSILAGHTQTVFIGGLGLAVYGLADSLQPAPHGRLRALARRGFTLAAAAGIALLLALPQLVPTLELTDVSNRRGGLNPSEAMAFSFNPLLAGRGLLPSYEGQVFTEYVAYAGVIGLGLALAGLWLADSRLRLAWGGLALVGLLLALGEANPLYWILATLPGFNLFRVPARWLALYALGVALLAGAGLRALLDCPRVTGWRLPALMIAMIGGLALSSLLAVHAPERVEGPAAPTLITWAGWGAALLALLAGLRYAGRWSAPLLALALLAELLLAAAVLPYNRLLPPDVYSATRFTASQLRVYGARQLPPGRMLSISELLFDPGDRAALEARYAQAGLDAASVRLGMIATKLQEVLAPNLPLAWGVPSVDGFDGGVLPTAYYTAFTSLMLPEGTLRTIDGRLRELLARPECRGICIPDMRWLNLTGTRYLITDKVYDLWHEGVAYDTALPITLQPGQTHRIQHLPHLEATALDVLHSGDHPLPAITLIHADGRRETLAAARADRADVDAFRRDRLPLAQVAAPQAIEITAEAPAHILALTLVDTRTGSFVQLAPGTWERVLSSDIKIFENHAVLPRAFVVHDARWLPDDEAGTESALAHMRAPDFDPAQTIILHTSDPARLALAEDERSGMTTGQSAAHITHYTAQQVGISVEAAADGWLLLADAYYPGWQASVDGAPAPVLRADVMFRAVAVPPGSSIVVLEYRPAWLPWLIPAGLGVWGLLVLILGAAWLRR